MTPEEKLKFIEDIKKKHDSEQQLPANIEKDKPLTDEELINFNDTISTTWKQKVLTWLKNFQTYDAKPSDMKVISEIVHQTFQQNKAIKDQQLGISDNNINVFQVENMNVVKLLKQNGLR